MADIKDKLVQAVNEFKKSLDGQTINTWKKLCYCCIKSSCCKKSSWNCIRYCNKIVSIDANTVVMQSDIYIDGVHVSTGHAEEKESSIKNKSNFRFGELRNLCYW